MKKARLLVLMSMWRMQFCKEIQATCKFKGEAFDALIPNLKAKRFDASISAIDITDARAKQVLFSDAYYDSTASYVTLKGKATLESAKMLVFKMEPHSNNTQ